jgi:hypothetical protein
MCRCRMPMERWPWWPTDDPVAATVDTWTEWVIDLQSFADQGVNLVDVGQIAVGLGATGDAGAAC